MSAAFSGPSAELGSQLHQGAKAYFTQVNSNGGVNGRLIELIARDDQYEPNLTVNNTRYFLDVEKVDALFSYVGTPTSHAILPLISNHQVPYITPFTGAEFLRRHSNIFNLRASYHDEAKAQIDYLVKQQGIKKIAFLIQADEFGLAVQEGLSKAMLSYGLEPTYIARFKRNSKDVSKALNKLQEKKPQAVCLVGTYEPLSRFINLASQKSFTPQFTSVSFVSSQELFKRLNAKPKLFVSEVMPDINNCKEAWCFRFKRVMASMGIKTPTRIHLEGYANAYVFSSAATNCPKLSTECLLKQLAIVKDDLKRNPRKHSDTSYIVGSNTVFLNHFSKHN